MKIKLQNSDKSPWIWDIFKIPLVDLFISSYLTYGAVYFYFLNFLSIYNFEYLYKLTFFLRLFMYFEVLSDLKLIGIRNISGSPSKYVLKNHKNWNILIIK